MKRARLFLVLAAFAALMLTSSWAAAGEIHPDLQLAIDQAMPGDMVGALVMMREQADIKALDLYLKDVVATRQVRHEAVVMTLQDKARRTQAGILDFIDSKGTRAEVDRVYPFWLINAVSLYAIPQVLQEPF